MNKNKPQPAPGPSQRMLRVGEMIRHAMAQMLTRGEIHDDDLSMRLISVPEVRMSPDLKIATVFIMPLGGEDVDGAIAALDRNKRYIRGEIAHAVNLKYAPDIRFKKDVSFDEARRIDQLLASDRVKRDAGKT